MSSVIWGQHDFAFDHLGTWAIMPKREQKEQKASA
jgi:hypothetical protein